MKTVKRYKYFRLVYGKIKSDSGEHTWEIGKWYKVTEELDICNVGFHCSKEVNDAFSYVQGEVVGIVECRGRSIVEGNKECWEEMKLTEARLWTKKESVSLSIFSAELVLKNYEKEYPDDMRPRQAIEAARKVLFEDTEENRSAARSAARSAWSAAESAESAWSAAESAAWSARSAESAAESAESAARSAESAWSAAESAESAAWSARSAESAESAAESAWSAARSAARSAAKTMGKIRAFMKKQYKELEEIK